MAAAQTGELRIHYGDSGYTYTWINPKGVSVEMPVIIPSARLSLTNDSVSVDAFVSGRAYEPDLQYHQDRTYYSYDFSDANPRQPYTKSAFAASNIRYRDFVQVTPVETGAGLTNQTKLSTREKDYILVLYHVYVDDFNRTYLDEASINDVDYLYVTRNPEQFKVEEAGPRRSPGWNRDEVGWWYNREDLTHITNDWLFYNNEWFYFDANGYMAVGWREIRGDWYFFNSIGQMMRNRNTPDGYFVDRNGRYVPR